MRPSFIAAALAIAIAIGAGTGFSAARAAELGMAAPNLSVSSWVKGGPVDISAGRGTNIYVVEFWATWCGPCLRTIPHLTELQKKFKDRGVTFVGVSDETLAKVKPFVEKQAEKMDYAVALDDQSKTTRAYLAAFGENGIPHAFVIDRQGRIAWHGHPAGDLERVLEEIVANRYDIEGNKRANSLVATANGYFEKLLGADPKAAREVGDKVLKEGAANPQLLNQFAWVILTHPRIPAQHRDLELATLSAKAAFDGSNGKDAGMIDTYARAMFASGKVKEAVELEKQAIAATTDAPLRAQLEKTLAEYSAKLP